MKWIKVEDKMPNINSTIVVCGEDGATKVIDFGKFGNGGLVMAHKSNKKVKVTHFIELPEHPTSIFNYINKD
jgi:hypothetical protein